MKPSFRTQPDRSNLPTPSGRRRVLHRHFLAGLFFLLIIFAAGPTTAFAQSIIYVDDDASGTGADGQSWATAYPSLQDALAAATSGDEIWVAEGVYTPVTPADADNVTEVEQKATFRLISGVEIYGGFAGTEGPGFNLDTRDWQAHLTILSGDIDGNDTTTDNVVTDPADIIESNSFSVVTGSGIDGTARLDGFTITAGSTMSCGGLGKENFPECAGGGMFNKNSAPMLVNLRFIGNHVTTAGGMANTDGSSPSLINVTFFSNRASSFGGGMANTDGSSPTLTNVTFFGNKSGGNGAGIYNRSYSNPTLTNVTFFGNVSGNDGAGIYNDNSSPILRDVNFVNNEAGYFEFTTPGYSYSGNGGGMYNEDGSSPTLTNVIFTGNFAGGFGGGMNNVDLFSSPTLALNPILTNVTFFGNSAGVGGGGIGNLFNSLTLDNVIIWGNESLSTDDNELSSTVSSGHSLVISHSLIRGGCPDDAICDEVIDVNPRFLSTNPEDTEFLHLSNKSPAINAGTNTPFEPGGAAEDVTTDLAGNDRIYNSGIVDMGAYEFQGNPGLILEPDDNILYVNQNVNDSAPGYTGTGDSWDNAVKELAVAMQWARSEHSAGFGWSDEDPLQIWVAAGTYKPIYAAGFSPDPTNRNNAFMLVPDVQVFGGFAGDEAELNERNATQIHTDNQVILSGDLGSENENSDNAYHVVISAGDVGSARLDGVTITGGHANGTTPITVNGEGILPFSGGGIASANSSPFLMNMWVTGNSAVQSGGGVFTINNGTPELVNINLTGNSAALGGGMYNSNSSAELVNVNLADNTAEAGGGIFNTNGGSLELINSIVWGNTADEGTGEIFTDADLTLSHSLVGEDGCSSVVNNGGTLTCGGADVIGGDPQFTDFDNEDYTLQPTSPAINAGDNDVIPSGLATDLAGNDRIYDSGTIDMGAYEFQGEPAENDEITPDDSNILYVNQNVSGGNGSGSSWANALPELADVLKWAREEHEDGSPGWDDGNPLRIFVAAGTYLPKYNAEDGSYTSDGGRGNAFVLVPHVQIYGGFNPGNGIETLDDERILPGDGEGTVLSGDLGTEEDESDNAYHVVVSAGEAGNAALDGLTLTGGYAFANPGDVIIVNEETIHQNRGGGMAIHNSNPALTHILFTSNSANEDGGGIYNTNSSPALTNITFEDNSAEYGGGMNIHAVLNREDSAPVLTNVLFTGNQADEETGYGGGLNNSGAPIFTNVIFTENQAGTGGGISNTGAISMTNSIVWGNDASYFGKEMYNAGTINLYHSLYRDGEYIIYDEDDGFRADEHSITAGPQFADPENGDYTLQSASPAINAGDPGTDLSIFPGGPDNPLDLAGNPRIYDGTPDSDFIDMGTYEFQGETLPEPGPIVLSAPSDEAENVPLQPELSWQPEENSDRYELVLSVHEDLSSPLIDEDRITETSYQHNENLEPAILYYWRVRGLNAGVPGEWSMTFEFTTRGLPDGGDRRALVGNHSVYTFSGSDVGISDDTYSIRIESAAGEGSLSTEAGDELTIAQINDGALSYTPPSGVHGYGFASFTFTIIDNEGNESDQAYTMSIDLAAAIVELTHEGDGWRFLTNPSNGDTYEDLLSPIWTKGVPGSDSPGATFPNVYTIDQANYQWEAPAGLNNATEPGRSFIVYVYGDDDNDGTPDGFPKTLTSGQNWQPLDGSFSFDGLGYGESPSNNPDNFYLIANPHPISLDFCGFNSTHVANSVDIWNPAANGGNGDYINLNCVADDVLIAPFQGFWVRTTDTNPVLAIPEAAYLGNVEKGYFKQPSKGSEPLEGLALAFTVQSEDNIFTNTARIVFSEEASEGLDAWDAPKLSPAGLAWRWLSFYSLDGHERAYALQNLPENFGEKISIPLDIETTEAGKYTLDWSLPESHVFNGSYFLRDNQVGQVIELREGAGYRFDVGQEEVIKVAEKDDGSDNSPLLKGVGGMSNEEPRFELLIAVAGIDGFTELGAVPEEFTLAQNYPNPFNPTTVISYQLPVNNEVRLEVYDLLGRNVATLVNGQVAAGRHTVNFDASGLSSGIYLYRLQAGGTIMTRKLTVLK